MATSCDLMNAEKIPVAQVIALNFGKWQYNSFLKENVSDNLKNDGSDMAEMWFEPV